MFLFSTNYIAHLIQPSMNCAFVNFLSPSSILSIQHFCYKNMRGKWNDPLLFFDGPIKLPRISPMKTQNPAEFQKLAPFTVAHYTLNLDSICRPELYLNYPVEIQMTFSLSTLPDANPGIAKELLGPNGTPLFLHQWSCHPPKKIWKRKRFSQL